jgi:hypothetical protein
MRLVVAILTAVATASLIAFALALRAGALAVNHTEAGLICGIVAGVLAFFHTTRTTMPRATRGEILLWIVFGLFAVRSFCWLLYFDKELLKVGAPNNLGDISRHILYARIFASGQPIWPDHPLHAWAMLRYYPGADFFQAMLQQSGLDERRALTWCGLVGSVLAAAALRRWGGAFAIAGFLFAGGLAGFDVFWTGVVKDYQMPLAWKPLPTAIFLTQRGFLFALPAALVLLAHWRGKFFPNTAPPPIEHPPVAENRDSTPRAWLRPEKPEPVIRPLPPPRAAAPFLPLWVEVTLLLGLAWFQLYAFLFLIGLLFFWLVAYFPRQGIRRHVATLLALSLPPAAALIALMTDFGAANFVHWQPGWMRKPRQDFIGFWILNFGLSLPLAAWLWMRLAWRRLRARSEGGQFTDAAEAFVIPAGLAFLACAFIAFAPWEWDNTKLMIWSYLIVLPFLWELLLAPSPVAVRWIGCGLLFFSGAVSLAGGLRANERGYELAKRAQLDELASDLRRIPLSARFACAPEYNHPLVLSGRRIAMGYDGHLFGYGLDYGDLRREVETLMLGRRGWQKSAARLGVTHVYWGPNEEKRYAKSSRPWEEHGRMVASGEWGKIFELNPTSATN